METFQTTLFEFEIGAFIFHRGSLCFEEWELEMIMFSFPETSSVAKALLLLSPTRRVEALIKEGQKSEIQ